MNRLQRLISIPLILALILSLGVVGAPPQATAQDLDKTDCATWCDHDVSGPSKTDLRETYPIMRLDRETLLKWEELYDSAPAVHIDPDVTPADTSPGSHDLLGLLDYVPLERNQGSCGNCWAWASTGVLGIALNVQEGVFDRLSIQYLNSNYNGGSGPNWACCGGNLWGLAGFYDPGTGTGQCIPWSNNNAYYQDATQNCAGSTNVPAGDITTFPNYGIDSCTAMTVPTHGLDQATAIANIKNVLHQDRAIYFGFSLPTSAEWGDFYTFWNSELETALWDPDPYCGMTMDDSGGGHGVLCVGYNDDDPDPDNYYWIMLNSWGTAGGNRPNGLFRVKMDINYDCILNWQSGGGFYALRWSTLDVDFDLTPPLDHFKFYAVDNEVYSGDPVYLEDQFGALDAVVQQAYYFGNPVEKEHGGVVTPISDPDHHLTLYELGHEAPYQEWYVEVNNQFGYQGLTVSGPVALVVPTQKDAHAPPEGLDHFLLYEVLEGPYIDVFVDLADQFGLDPGVMVLQPVALGNPVGKTHDGAPTEIVNPDAHLVFYQIVSENPFYTSVEATNQFGAETFSLGDAMILAVPSEKVRFMAGEPVKRVAVLGDYNSQLTDLLWANNMLAEQRDWDVISDIADYEVVVVNMPSDPGQATFLDFLDAASDNRVGVVFTSSYAVLWGWGISLLEWHLADPAGQAESYYQGNVYYRVTAEHPIFAGWNVGDEITIIDGGDHDHAWFWDYSGDVIGEVGAASIGIRGDAVAVRAYGGSKHVLLASLGPQSWTNVPDWTADAETIFINAVHYAQPEPEPAPLDHFKFYWVDDAPVLGEPVYLEDQFSGLELVVGNLILFGNPVAKWHDGLVTPISDPDHHLSLYTLGHEPGFPFPCWEVEVDNQFGPQTLIVSGPAYLAVPTHKLSPGEHEAPVGLDHFMVYEVKNGPFLEVLVGLEDEFGYEEVLVLYPILFANPVRKTHGADITEIENPEEHLVFYWISGGSYDGEVLIANQFDEDAMPLLTDAAFLAAPTDKISYKVHVGATIDPTEEDYDLTHPADVATTITWNDSTAVADIFDGTDFLTLTAGTDYTVVGNTLAILDAYLAAKLTASGQSLDLIILFDDYCCPLIFTITAVQGVSPTIDPAEADYDLTHPDDVTTTITWNDASSVVSVEDGVGTLTAGTDYTVVGNTLTVLDAYLSGKLTGAGQQVELTITFDYCNPLTFTITAVQGVSPTIDPTEADYDLTHPDDVTTTITWNDASSVVSVEDGVGTLTAGTDYTVVGNTLTILNAYLSGKLTAAGQQAVLAITFDYCNPLTFTITAVEGIPCEVSGTFTSSRYKPGTWSYALSIVRTGLGEFVSGTIELTAPDQSEVVAVVEAVKCNYACWYNHPAVSKPNFAAAGTATYGTWTGNFMFLLADSHIQMVLSTDDYSDEWAAETLWAPGLRAYDILAVDGGFWAACLCPPPPPACATIDPTAANYNLLGPANVATAITWNGATGIVSIHDGAAYLAAGTDYTVVGSTLTILNAYLATKLTAGGQSVVLTIDFDYCNPATFTITAVEGTVCETSGTFTSSRHKPGTWSYAVSIVRTGLGEFVSGTIELTAPDQSEVVAVVEAVKCNYACWYNHPAVSKPNFAAAGTATYGTWTGNFMFLLADSHIQMVLSTDDYSDEWAAETLWAPGLRAYDILAVDGGFWAACLCPPPPPACATIDPTAANYNLLGPANVATAITWNGATGIVSIHDGAAYLAAGTDYTVAYLNGTATLTILNAYLGTKLTAGGQSVVLTIDFDYCNPATFTITAVEGTVCETSGTFTSERYKPGTWNYALSIVRTGLGEFVSGTIELTAPDQSEVVAVVEAVKCNYACWYNHPAVSKPNFAAAGTATYGTWTGNFMFLLADSHIQMVLSTDDYSDEWAAETLWAPGLRAYDILAVDGGFWAACLCPAMSCETSGTFTSERYKPGTWSYALSIVRTGLGEFVSGTIELTAPDQSEVVAVVEAVKCNYACWYNHPAVSKPNFAAAGTATYGTWTGYFIFLLADSHIQMVLSTDDYSDEWAAETLWPSGLRAYDILAVDGGFWAACLCPL